MTKKTPSGKYRGRVQICVDKDGKPISKYVSAKTRRELEQKKEYIRHHYVDGHPIREDLPFYQYAEEWYTLKKEPFISDASRSAYRTMFNKHLLPAFGLRHLRAISAGEIQAFINSFADSSKSQITLAVGTVKALFASAYAEGIIERDPSVSIIRPKAKKKTERRALTDQETENVLHTIQNHEHGLFLAVLYYLGLRRGEALGLQWGDFDFDEDLVHIQRDIDYVGSTAHDGALKTAAANRYIPIPQELRAMLSNVRGFPQQYVFHTEEGQPWPQSSFKRIWLSLMEASYCVEEREVTKATKRKNDIIKQLKPTLTPHYFRHNYATLLFEAGVEPLIAMKILGHTDYQTTASHDAIEVIFVDLIIELRSRREEGQLCCRTLQIPVHDLQQCLHVVRTIPIFLARNHLQVGLRSYANCYLILPVD